MAKEGGGNRVYLKLFLLFCKLGFVSIGGGYPMMGLILQEGAADVGLTTQEFADMTALELLASGPISINAATYIGFIKGGFPGAVFATLGVCTAPFVLTTILYYFLSRFKENLYVNGFIDAIKVASGGILLTTAGVLARGILLMDRSMGEVFAQPLQSVRWFGALIAAICIAAILKWKADPIVMILVSAVLGMILLS